MIECSVLHEEAPRRVLDNSVEHRGVTYRFRMVAGLLICFQGSRITTSWCINKSRFKTGHDESVCYSCSLTFAFSIYVTPNYTPPPPPLPLPPLSSCSLLWKLLLAHPRTPMTAFSLIRCHSTSSGAAEELLSSDM